MLDGSKYEFQNTLKNKLHTPVTRVGSGARDLTQAENKISYGTSPSNSYYPILFCTNHLVGLKQRCIPKISFVCTPEVGEKP